MAATVAVIDIGSNSIKLLVATRAPHGAIQTLTARTVDARISAGLGQARPLLGAEGMARGVDAVSSLLAESAGFHPEQTLLVATSAVRDAANGAEFRERVRAATGHTLRILSGEEEANLIGRGLTSDPALARLRDFYVFDLGGGSLECLAFRARQMTQAISLPLGCVRLTERLVADVHAPLPSAACTAIAQHTRATLAASGFAFDPAIQEAVFAGGSMTTVRTILAAATGKSLAETSPVIGVDTLRRVMQTAAALPLAQRKTDIAGLPAARADVFPAALATIIAVCEAAGLTALHHSLYNLRYGLADELLGA